MNGRTSIYVFGAWRDENLAIIKARKRRYGEGDSRRHHVQPKESGSSVVNSNASNTVRESLYRLMKGGHEAGDESVIEEIVAPDFVLHCPDGSRKTRSESADTYAAMRNALTSYTITCDLMVAEANMVAARTAMHGIFTNPFPLTAGQEIEAHGGPVHFETISIYRFDDQGQLTEEWAQSDNMTLFSQLGLNM